MMDRQPRGAKRVHGPTALHRRLHDARRGLLFAGYYGLQHAEYGHGPGGREPVALAALATPAQAQPR